MKINPMFASIAPPLKDCEFRLLKEDILERGCITPLITWKGFIVDGHNRYRICKEYDIPFTVQEMAFADEQDAALWIAKKHLGRRNLTPFSKCEMVYPFEDALKEEARKRMGSHDSSFTGRTRDILADMAGVSHGSFNKAKRIILEGDEETKRRLRAGEISINRAYTELVSNNTHSTKESGGSVLPEIEYELDALRYSMRAGTVDYSLILKKLDELSVLVKEERKR